MEMDDLIYRLITEADEDELLAMLPAQMPEAEDWVDLDLELLNGEWELAFRSDYDRQTLTLSRYGGEVGRLVLDLHTSEQTVSLLEEGEDDWDDTDSDDVMDEDEEYDEEYDEDDDSDPSLVIGGFFVLCRMLSCCIFSDRICIPNAREDRILLEVKANGPVFRDMSGTEVEELRRSAAASMLNDLFGQVRTAMEEANAKKVLPAAPEGARYRFYVRENAELLTTLYRLAEIYAEPSAWAELTLISMDNAVECALTTDEDCQKLTFRISGRVLATLSHEKNADQEQISYDEEFLAAVGIPREKLDNELRRKRAALYCLYLLALSEQIPPADADHAGVIVKAEVDSDPDAEEEYRLVWEPVADSVRHIAVSGERARANGTLSSLMRAVRAQPAAEKSALTLRSAASDCIFRLLAVGPQLRLEMLDRDSSSVTGSIVLLMPGGKTIAETLPENTDHKTVQTALQSCLCLNTLLQNRSSLGAYVMMEMDQKGRVVLRKMNRDERARLQG